MKYLFVLFLAAFIAANLIVREFGAWGLIISSALLIPFDFVIRCLIHEKYSGWKLLTILLLLTICAAGITVLIYPDSKNIATGSICGFVAAQAGAGIFYQLVKRKTKSYLLKVNVSDLIAVSFDSLAFQWVAFGVIGWYITGGQILIKFLGGVLWYLILFELLKIQKWISKKN